MPAQGFLRGMAFAGTAAPALRALRKPMPLFRRQARAPLRKVAAIQHRRK